MKLIKKITEMMDEELAGAKAYAELAIEHKEHHPELSKTFYEIAVMELSHADMLHAQAAKLIEKRRQAHDGHSESIDLICEWIHEHKAKQSKVVKEILSEY